MLKINKFLIQLTRCGMYTILSTTCAPAMGTGVTNNDNTMSLIRNSVINKNGVVSRETRALLTMEDCGISTNITVLVQDTGCVATSRKIL